MRTESHIYSRKSVSTEGSGKRDENRLVRQNEIDEAWRVKEVLDSMTPAQKLLFDKMDRVEALLQNIVAHVGILSNP